jgi:Ca2+/H+ antiporter
MRGDKLETNVSTSPFVLVPLAILANMLRLGPQAEFITAFLALVPLAGLLGEATEELATHTDRGSEDCLTRHSEQ